MKWRHTHTQTCILYALGIITCITVSVHVNSTGTCMRAGCISLTAAAAVAAAKIKWKSNKTRCTITTTRRTSTHSLIIAIATGSRNRAKGVGCEGDSGSGGTGTGRVRQVWCLGFCWLKIVCGGGEERDWRGDFGRWFQFVYVLRRARKWQLDTHIHRHIYTHIRKHTGMHTPTHTHKHRVLYTQRNVPTAVCCCCCSATGAALLLTFRTLRLVF